MENQERWRKVKGFEDYSISNLGRVYSQKRGGKILKPNLDKDGYLYVNLYNRSRHTKKKIHRLVTQMFILNPLNYPQVNHKNGIKADNRISNLEWITHKENMIHARDVLEVEFGKSLRRPIIGTNIKTNEQIRFKSTAEAERNGFDHRPISACCLKRPYCHSHRGYIWNFA